MDKLISYSCVGGVATLTMDDGKANAISPAMCSALNTDIDRAVSEAKVLVIRGRDDLFCGGFDLKIIRGDDEVLRNIMRDAGMALLKKIYLLPCPVIFAVTGHAVAMGALLILTGDMRIGLSGEFRVGLSETRIGLPLPVTGLEIARDRLNSNFFQRATINAEMFSPEDALAAGYLDEVVGKTDFDDLVVKASESLCDLDVDAFAETKRRVRQPILNRIASLEA